MQATLAIEGFSLLVYQSVLLWTACHMLGRWVSRLGNIPDDFGLTFPIGFGLLMALVPWAGFAGLGKLALVWELLGVLIFGVGVWRLGKWRPSFVSAWKMSHWFVLLTPLAAVVTVLYSKRCYLLGGINNSDEFRSLLLVGGMANNGLVPTFPFDASAPISYSYGVFAVGAWLYRSVHGVGFPSIPVLLVNAFVLVYFYYLLFQLTRQIFAAESVSRAFIIISATVTFYGFDYWMIDPSWGHVEWWTSFQIAQAASQQIFTYQYVWAGICCLVALVHLHRFLRVGEPSSFVASMLMFVFASLSGAITFAWGVLCIAGVVTASVVFAGLPAGVAWQRIKAAGRVPWLWLAVCAALWLPQVFTYVARDTLFSLSIHPRFWESREYVFSANFLPHFKRAVADLLADLGPFLVFALVASWVYWFRPRKWDVARVSPFLGIIGVCSLLMTFSYSAFFDWTARGFLVASLALPFVLAEFVIRNEQLLGKPWIGVLATLVLVPQIYNYAAECRFRSGSCWPAGERAVRWNQQIPFETFVHALDRRQVDLLGFAGRPMVTAAHEGQIKAYLNNETFLENVIDWKTRFSPCQRSRFGRSTPLTYLEMAPGDMPIQRSCNERLSRR